MLLNKCFHEAFLWPTVETMLLEHSVKVGLSHFRVTTITEQVFTVKFHTNDEQNCHRKRQTTQLNKHSKVCRPLS